MSSLKSRLNKLSKKIKPPGPVFILRPGEELTADQELQIAQAAARGQEAIIIRITRAGEGRRDNDNKAKS